MSALTEELAQFREEQRKAVEAAIERSKDEILRDLVRGTFAYRNERADGFIVCFSDLHDYVDANYYGGLCDIDQYPEFWEEDEDGNVDQHLANAVQDGVDKWLRSLGPINGDKFAS